MASNDRVETLIRKFAADLQIVIREQLSSEVTSAVQGALGGKPARGGNGRASAGALGKRSPEQIAKQAEKIFAFIKANPDQRAEQIARANKMSTAELVLPIKRLLEEKKIKSSGKARGTTYAVTK
jgi:predicted HTH transcriptional regulator